METLPAPPPSDPSTTTSASTLRRIRTFLWNHVTWVVLLAILALAVFLFATNQAFRSWAEEVWGVVSTGDQQRIRDYLRGYGAWGPTVSVGLMTLQAIIAPIPASLIQLANGVVYGLFGGALLNLIGQFAGATVAFFIARWLGRDAAEKLAGKFDQQQRIEHFIDRWGVKALFLVRAVPGMPSDFVSYAMGLTNMSAPKYLTVSFFGYIPQSFAYSYLGDAATDYFWWFVVAGFCMSFVLAGILWVVNRIRRMLERPTLEVNAGRESS